MSRGLVDNVAASPSKGDARPGMAPEGPLRRSGRSERAESQLRERTNQLEEASERLRQAERLATIGSMAAGLGHDMSNITLAIRLQLGALRSRTLPDDVRHELDSLGAWIDSLAELGAGIRLLAADPDRVGTRPERTDIETWWETCEPLLRRSVPEGVVLESDVHALGPVSIGAPGLSQAVLNLVVNAGQAIGQRPGRIVVRTELDGSWLLLHVEDDGPGMDDATLARATEAFFTTKAVTPEGACPTGLGLALARGVVERSGGELSIDSRPGHGTRVSLRLPMALTDAERRAPAAPAAVSVADPRTAAYARALLTAFGLDPVDGLPACDTPPRVWVAQDTDAEFEAACALRAHGDRVGMIVVGPVTSRWDALGVSVVRKSDGLCGLREVVAREVAR